MPLNAVQKLLGLEGKIQAVKVSALTVPKMIFLAARANTDALMLKSTIVGIVQLMFRLFHIS